jgi:broad specificity phosphatase PhoE
MELEITLIRHGLTKSGIEGVYSSNSEEPLSSAGIQSITKNVRMAVYPKASRLYTSPTMSCLQTTSLIYGSFPAIILGSLLPFDYGDFSGHTYDEIAASPRFDQRAEGFDEDKLFDYTSMYVTMAKNVAGFKGVVSDMLECEIRKASVVTHRESIMMIMNRFGMPLHRYFEGDVDYGGGYTVLYNSRLSTLEVKKSF